MNTKVTLSLLLTISFLVSCSTHKSDISPLLSSDCEPPCWQNIIPNKTTEQELLTILRKLSIVDKNSINSQRYNSETFDKFVGFKLINSDIYIRVYLFKERVLMISFSHTLETTIGQIVERIGEPEKIFLLGNPGGAEVNLIKPLQGVWYGYQTTTLKSEISSNTNVEWINFFDPNLYEALLKQHIFYITIEKNLRVWNGYGVLEDKYWP